MCECRAVRLSRPPKISEVLDQYQVLALLEALDSARLLAGRQSLVPYLNFRQVRFQYLIDLNFE
jgi:CO/xanthine dehydrogenase FAD-binding subunit